MSDLKQWRVALDRTIPLNEKMYYHNEMMGVLEAGERIAENRDILIRKLQTIKNLTSGSREVAGIDYLAESALEEAKKI